MNQIENKIKAQDGDNIFKHNYSSMVGTKTKRKYLNRVD